MHNESEIHLLFPTVVQLSEIENAGELNRKLLKEIYEIQRTTPNTIPDSWCCNVYTTINSPMELLENEGFRELKDVILTEVTKYANTLKFDVANFKLRINECWVNIYSTGHAQEMHIHQNSVISGIYFVKAPAGCSPVMFDSPVADIMLEPPKTETNSLNLLGTAVNAIEGRMVIFRSYLRHGVKPNNIDEDRVSISFNVTM